MWHSGHTRADLAAAQLAGPKLCPLPSLHRHAYIITRRIRRREKPFLALGGYGTFRCARNQFAGWSWSADHVTPGAGGGGVVPVPGGQGPGPAPAPHLLFTPGITAAEPQQPIRGQDWSETNQSEPGISRHWVQCHVRAFPLNKSFPPPALSWFLISRRRDSLGRKRSPFCLFSKQCRYVVMDTIGASWQEILPTQFLFLIHKARFIEIFI